MYPLTLHRFTTRFSRDQRGVTALEYGLIAALIALAIVGAVTNVSSHLITTFNSIATTLQGAGG